MTGRRLRAVRVLALVLALGVALPAGAQAKKKKSSNVFTKQLSVNGAIPDRPGPNTVSTPLISTIQVPKAFKGKVVKDLNVTGVQLTGTAGTTPVADVNVSLVAPNGRTVYVFQGIGDTAVGPFTIDDDTLTSICNASPPAQCADPTQSLYRPFIGTANTIWNAFGGFPTNGPLATFDGVKMRGAWTLIVSDTVANETSTLNQWGLRITGKRG